MKTIKEIAESYAQWILRREGALKSAQLPKVLEGMLKEQKDIDDANLAEVKRQRDEYYDELQKLRRHKVELIEWLNEEASRCREWAKTGYDGYEIGTLEGKYTQAEDTIDKIKGMEE